MLVKILRPEGSPNIFAYNGENGRLISAPVEALPLLESLSSGADPADDGGVVLEQLRGVGFFDIPAQQADPTFSHLIMNISQDCNLACGYCFAHEGVYRKRGRMTEQTAMKVIDYLAAGAGSADRPVHVTFFGGEPLLEYSLMKSAVERCRSIEASTGRKFSFSITTNGTLVTPEITDYLIKENFTVQVSIDGDRSMHDRNRRDKEGAGSYETVIRNTASLRKKSPVLGKATVTSDNADMAALFEHLCSLGFCGVPITEAFDSLDSEGFRLMGLEMRRLVSSFDALVRNGEAEKARKLQRTAKVMNRIHLATVRRMCCGAGTSMRCADIDGNIYPCHRLSAAGGEFCMGNVYGSVDEGLFNDIAGASASCAGCWAKGLCAGGCPATNHAMTGDPGCPDEEFCAYQRGYLEALLEIYCLWDKDMKESFFGPAV